MCDYGVYWLFVKRSLGNRENNLSIPVGNDKIVLQSLVQSFGDESSRRGGQYRCIECRGAGGRIHGDGG